MPLDDFLRNRLARPNPTVIPPRWGLYRASSAFPRGRARKARPIVWERVEGRWDDPADAEAELTCPAAPLAPGDFYVVRPELAPSAREVEAHSWIIGAEGRGHRLPAIAPRIEPFSPALAAWAMPYGANWVEARAEAARGDRLLALAVAAGIDARPVVAAAMAVVRPQVEQSEGPETYRVPFEAIEAWTRGAPPPPDLSALADDALDRTTTTRTPNDPEGREAASAVYHLLTAVEGSPGGTPNSASRASLLVDLRARRTQRANDRRAEAARAAEEARQADQIRLLLPLAAFGAALSEHPGEA